MRMTGLPCALLARSGLTSSSRRACDAAKWNQTKATGARTDATYAEDERLHDA